MKKVNTVVITDATECSHHRNYVELDADANEVDICLYYGEGDPYICRFAQGKCPLPDADETDADKEEGNGEDYVRTNG
jgi:hypothetical protein